MPIIVIEHIMPLMIKIGKRLKWTVQSEVVSSELAALFLLEETVFGIW